MPYDEPTFRALVEAERQRALNGQAPSTFGDRLFDLTDPRITVYNLADAGVASGALLVAYELNQGWGTSYTEQTVRGVLDAGAFP